MEKRYLTLVIGSTELSGLEKQLGEQYQLSSTPDLDGLLAMETLPHLILLDKSTLDRDTAKQLCHDIHSHDKTHDIPLIVLTDQDESVDRMDIYAAGCDDLITRSAIELKPRIDRILFNKLANDQLKQQLQQANEIAFFAMSDSSNIGVNIQFLLESENCNNLDELGMCLFRALKCYDLVCSIQMRGLHDIKNMEANGMEKKMESELLTECQDHGDYIAFGKRIIINHESVSVLVKNMPADDEKKYNAIKDNLLSLLQGTNARIKALDNITSLRIDSALLQSMYEKMRTQMTVADEIYQSVMRDIATVVEDISEGVENSLQYLDLEEYQEKMLQDILEIGVTETNKVFNRGLRVDKELGEFLNKVDNYLGQGVLQKEEVTQLLERAALAEKTRQQ